MADATSKSGGWGKVRKRLAGWEQPALLGLVKELYETAGVNRDLIHARGQVGEGVGGRLERYRARMAGRVGLGYGEYVGEVVSRLERRFGTG